MKSESKKTESNLMALKKELAKGKALSAADIMQLLGCNRRSAYNYLNRLSGETELQQIRSGRIVRYSLSPSGPDHVIPYAAISLDILRKYLILSALRGGPVRKEHFQEKFSFSKKSEIYGKKLLIDVGMTKYYEILKELLKEKEIAEIQGSYILTGSSVPLRLFLTEDELYNLNEELSSVPGNSPYHAQLMNILDKTKLLIGEPDTDYNYILYGRIRTQMQNIHKYLQLLLPYDYRHKVIRITYRPRSGVPETVSLSVGSIVYSEEKDRLYILGEAREEDASSEGGFRPLIIRLDTVISISEEEEENLSYESASYLSLFDDMFGISLEPPVNVSVRFNDVPFIRRKIQTLLKQRKTASVSHCDGEIIYRDRISGIYDFAAYLRSFGRGCRVEEPEELKELMIRTVDRSLERYEETENEL